jgi:D-amino-acid dehydrogenase
VQSVGIIGGGIIGLSSAYYLSKAGFRVTIFDQGDFADGCSYGNAGMIVPSHITPLSSPGMISRGLRWMFNSSSPFYIKPRLDKDLFSWGYQFYKHSNAAHVEYAIPALKEFSLFSKSIYQQWTEELPFDFGYKERGLLMLYQQVATEKEEVEAAHAAQRAGIDANVLSLTEIQAMEPDVRVKARGGVYYPGDAQVIPGQLAKELAVYLKQCGVEFKPNTRITGFQFGDRAVQAVRTSEGEMKFDFYVVAGGAWSGIIGAMLGIRILMQGGKGYSFTLPKVEKNTRIPTILMESRVAVTPMADSLRFGGTMEIAGINHSVNMKRVKGIVNSIPAYYPEMKIAVPLKEQVWCGLRPCSPDGLPYVGRSRKRENVVIATGHSMMGQSLGPGTGKLVSEIILDEHPSIPLNAFDAERYD